MTSSLPRFETLSSTAKIIEAILFAAPSPVSVNEMATLLSLSPSAVKSELEDLRSYLLRHEHGITVIESAGGWRMATAEDVSEIVGAFRETAIAQKIRLSKAAVETLAVIAYNQPVTRSEIEELRGVRCERVIETLLSHALIRIAGRRKATGSPLLYRTTDRFLETFGVLSISELPTLEELDELAPVDEPHFVPVDEEERTNG
ncbi:MAG TPA: SMC-Scp complex subunit ScpB [Synergistales bacterium]|nr:SMC-Scp complex subunit ScpB [Synergistales bacterium]HRV97199.1 SMC-Scp complex subunit ScpB [Aminobacteriaceae bacterium]